MKKFSVLLWFFFGLGSVRAHVYFNCPSNFKSASAPALNVLKDPSFQGTLSQLVSSRVAKWELEGTLSVLKSGSLRFQCHSVTTENCRNRRGYVLVEEFLSSKGVIHVCTSSSKAYSRCRLAGFIAHESAHLAGVTYLPSHNNPTAYTKKHDPSYIIGNHAQVACRSYKK